MFCVTTLSSLQHLAASNGTVINKCCVLPQCLSLNKNMVSLNDMQLGIFQSFSETIFVTMALISNTYHSVWM